MTPAADPSLLHLQAELARLDARLRREVQRWQLAGQDPHDAFRGLRTSDEEALALLDRPFAASWGQTVSLGAAAEAFSAQEAAAERQASALAAQAAAAGQPVRLQQLVEAFGLDRFALDAFLVCLAPTLDLRYERLYGYLQDDVTRRRPTVNLILDLLCDPGPQRLARLEAFADDAPLLAHDLLERVAEPGAQLPPLLAQAFAADDGIVAWLLGRYQPHAALGRYARLLPPYAAADDALLAGEAGRGLAPLVAPAPRAGEDRVPGSPPVIVLYGPDHTAQQAALRGLGAAAGRPLLMVSLAALVGPDRPALRVVRAALRDARLTGAVPCLCDWDVCLSTDGASLPALLAEVLHYPDLLALSGQAAWQPRGLDRERRLVWVEFPLPAFDHRLTLWDLFVRRRLGLPPGASLPAALDLPDLAGQFMLSAAQIGEAVAAAADHAAQRGAPLDRQDLFLAARSYSNPSLATLAHKIEARYAWDDLVLPADQLSQLREIIATVRGRPLVLEAWGVGRKLASSAGVTVLFAGPPGTGKTMAAEVIAGELGLELYKIDLSTVVNKYIGETEKNLSRIFDEAATSNAILFFDEADAVFGKRSEVKDAHDRYANIEVSYLLQRMETYDGVTILATNLRANLDDAFTRRLQFAVDFPFPDEAYRLRIWQALFPPGVPRAAELDFPLLARRFKLAGGNIRNIIVSAAYLAAADGGQVTMAHLLHGARRELQKMGRLLKEKELTYG
jgi:hypothetical protein